MTVVNFYFLLLTSLVIVSFASLLFGLHLFYKVKRLVDLAQKSLQLEGKLEESIANKLAEVGRGQLANLLLGYERNFKKLSEVHFAALNNSLSAETRALGAFIKKQEDLVVKQSQYAVERVIAKTVEEIEQYKEYQMKRVEEEATNAVSRVIKEVVGRAITLEEQEELVGEALRAARASGIFNAGGGSGGSKKSSGEGR